MSADDPNSPARRAWIKRGLQVALEVLIVGYLVYYFSTQADKLERVLSLRLSDAAALIGLGLVGIVLRSWELGYLVGRLGGRIPYWQAASLTMGCTLLNYLPMNAGMIVKARVLKKHVGVQYAHFVSLTAGQLLITVMGGASLGLIVLGLSWGTSPTGRWAVAGIFAAALAGCLAAFHTPASSIAKGSGWVRTALRDFLDGLESIRRRRGGVLLLLLLSYVKLLVLAVKFRICFSVLGVEATFLACVVLAVLAVFTTLVAITPAGLGVREVLVGLTAAITGLSFEFGVTAAALDRVLITATNLVCGVAGLAILRAKKVL